MLGHSYGDYTARAAAGARLDSAEFTAHCEAAARAKHPAAWLCDMLLTHLPEMAELAGLDTLPDGLWPGWGDEWVAEHMFFTNPCTTVRWFAKPLTGEFCADTLFIGDLCLL
ncbi:MAG: hypothetical protein KDE34_17545 [Anaerolineales bacterium]|nr:hypothetical protein [Anaerolineales bacterium]